MASSLERELTGVSADSLGISFQDRSKNRWAMPRSNVDCIVKRLKESGFTTVSVTKTQMKGSGTVYIFEFSPRYERTRRQTFMLRFNDVLTIEVDMGEVEMSLREGERTQRLEDVIRARLDVYANAVKSCSRSGIPETPVADIDDLAEGMRRMTVGGRATRRQKKRRATRRR
jgi:hypothetical protein